jgi:hypothetical protein
MHVSVNGVRLFFDVEGTNSLLAGGQNETGARGGAGNSDRFAQRLRVCVQHGDRAAILRPAGDVVANCDRAFLAVGDGAHAAAIDAA